MILPAGRNALMQLAARMADAVENHAGSLRSTDVSPADLCAALVQLRQAQMIFANARTATGIAAARLADDAKTLATWLGKARLALMLAYGPRWSQQWLEAGFTERTTSVPKELEPRIALAASVVKFLAHKPEFGIPHAGVTAMCGRKLHTTVVNGRQILYQLALECEATRQARDRAERRLRQQLRAVVNLLATTMHAKDSRWPEFGFKLTRSRRGSRLIPIKQLDEISFADADHAPVTTAVAA